MTRAPRWEHGLMVALASVALFGCNEGTLSLFPRGADSSDGPSSAGMPNPPAAVEPGLTNEWPLDMDARDSIGQNDGTLQGNAAFVSDAVRGEVLTCDGNSSAILLSNQTPLEFSYAVWIWTDVPSSQGEDARAGDAILWSNDATRFDDFMLSLLNDRLSFMSYNEKSTGTRSLTDASWHHVVVTRRDAERVALYVDGQADGDGNAGSGPVLANQAVYVCANPEAGHYFSGKVDDLRLYDRVLSPADVLELYERTLL